MVRFQSRPQHVYGLPRTLTVARIIGFTLIELLVVMTIIATLLTLAVPRYFGGVDRAKEAVFETELATLRDCIDKYNGDTGRYPIHLMIWLPRNTCMLFRTTRLQRLCDMDRSPT
jgi:prepilin-type N-terminal cleavage/methylation domain-containing protein